MKECEFEKIILEVISSFNIDDIVVPNEVVLEMKNKYVVSEEKKKLVRSKGGVCYDNRRK